MAAKQRHGPEEYNIFGSPWRDPWGERHQNVRRDVLVPAYYHGRNNYRALNTQLQVAQ